MAAALEGPYETLPESRPVCKPAIEAMLVTEGESESWRKGVKAIVLPTFKGKMSQLMGEHRM
jgi:hypothetical protein